MGVPALDRAPILAPRILRRSAGDNSGVGAPARRRRADDNSRAGGPARRRCAGVLARATFSHFPRFFPVILRVPRVESRFFFSAVPARISSE